MFEGIVEVDDITISAFLGTNISKDSTIIGDEWKAYRRVLKNADDWFSHRVANHSNKEYVRYEDIKVSINGIEGMRSCLKRGLKGIYIKVSKKHLPNYLNEFEFRPKHKDIIKNIWRGGNYE